MKVDFHIESNIKELMAQVEQNADAALEACGIQAENYSKLELENSPRRIDTGNLRNSITHTVSGDEKTVYIGSNVEYGVYVHEGTVRMAPNRFLKNAMTRHVSEYKKILESYLFN